MSWMRIFSSSSKLSKQKTNNTATTTSTPSSTVANTTSTVAKKCDVCENKYFDENNKCIMCEIRKIHPRKDRDDEMQKDNRRNNYAAMLHSYNGRNGFNSSNPKKRLRDALPEIYCSVTPKVLEAIQERKDELRLSGLNEEDCSLQIKEEFGI